MSRIVIFLQVFRAAAAAREITINQSESIPDS